MDILDYYFGRSKDCGYSPLFYAQCFPLFLINCDINYFGSLNFMISCFKTQAPNFNPDLLKAKCLIRLGFIRFNRF